MKLTGSILVLSALSMATMAQKQNNPALTPVFQDNTYQLTGVAVSKSGRIFTNYPHWSDTYTSALVEVGPNNKKNPFPNAEWNNWKPGEDVQKHWICVQAVVIDDQDMMWVVDPASPKQKGVVDKGQKLVKINLKTNQVTRVFPLATATSSNSYINDVRVDTKSGFAYLTNSTEGGIVIVDLKSGKARQVLQGTRFVTADPDYKMKINGALLQRDGKPFHVNSDGIALNPNGTQLYFKSLTDNQLFIVPTIYLRDEKLSPSQLSAKVRSLGHFTTTDGIAMDKKGNLFLGDVEKRRIVQITPDLKMNVITDDPKLIWPDSYHITDDNYLYISSSMIDQQPQFHQGISQRKLPYTIYKIKLPN